MSDNLVDVERAVVRVLLNDAEALVAVSEALPEARFFATARCGQVYQAMLDLARLQVLPNVATVAEHLHVPLAQVQELAAGYSAKDAREVVYLAELVAREGQRRLLLLALREATEMAQEPTDDVAGLAYTALQMVAGTSNEMGNRRDPAVAAVGAELDERQRQLANVGSLGFATRLPWLNDKTSGLTPATVWVISGPYKWGRKCVTGDTWILTSKGYTRIGDLLAEIPFGFSECDLDVWGRGAWRHVPQVFRAPIGPILQIETHNGLKLAGTPEHPVLVATTGGVVWRELKDITVGTFVAIERAQEIITTVSDCVPPAVLAPLVSAIAQDYYFDPVTSITFGESETFDLVVPDGNAFMSNGLISHNTSIAKNLIIDACRAGAAVDFFALEGDRVGAFASLLAMLATEKLLTWRMPEEAILSDTFVLRGMRSEMQLQALTEARRELESFRLFIYDGRDGIGTPERIAIKLRRDKMLHGVSVMVVDYLQLLGLGKLFDRLEAATHAMQRLIVEQELCGVLIAQLNESAIWQMRAEDDAYSPGIKGGGDPAAAADYLFRTLVSLTDPTDLTIELKLARHARPGKIHVRLNEQSGHIMGQIA